MKSRKGLTLIELVMTATLVSLISLALYSSLASGINVARRVARPISDEDLAIFFEKFSREISNSFPYSEIPFQGDEIQFSLPTTVVSEMKFGSDLAVGRVTYLYESSRDSLNREQENVNQIYKKEKIKPVPVLREISAVTFEYFGYDPLEKVHKWFEEWDSVAYEGKLPSAIKIKLEYFDEGKKRQLVRVVPIPAGG